jgi:hypothetical protein
VEARLIRSGDGILCLENARMKGNHTFGDCRPQSATPVSLSRSDSTGQNGLNLFSIAVSDRLGPRSRTETTGEACAGGRFRSGFSIALHVPYSSPVGRILGTRAGTFHPSNPVASRARTAAPQKAMRTATVMALLRPLCFAVVTASAARQ